MQPFEVVSLVSILIPCRNAAATLGETLASAASQKGCDIEMIVSDSGSSDASLEIARSFGDPRVRVVEKPGANASSARNAALAAARGDYIQYLDADDLLGAGKIRLQLEVLSRHPRHLAFGRWGRFNADPEAAVFANDDQLRDWTPVEWLLYALDGGRMMHPAAWLVPRAVAVSAGWWDESLTLNDDGEYFARVIASSDGLKVVAEARSLYRTTSSPSLSKSRGQSAYASLLRSLEGTAKVLIGLEDSARTRRTAADLMKRFVFYVYPSVPGLRKKAEALANSWGGSELTPDLGPRGRLLSSVIGWRAALVLAKRRRASKSSAPW